MVRVPQILDISFSDLRRDARVLRQLSVVAQHGEVTTVGYGPAPDLATHHLEVPRSATSLPQTPLGVARLALHRFRSAEVHTPAYVHAARQLRGRTFNAVVANDARALPLALDVADGAPVWVDLHEWAPEERTQVLSWRLLVAPMMDDICATHLPRVAHATTVGGRIADLYEERYGVRPLLMRNAAPWAPDLRPTPVPAEGPIRLVHSGGAVPGRSLEVMIDAVVAAGERFTLDLYLVPAADGGRYLAELRSRAAPHPGITFHPPVPPADLPATLNAHDVGVFWIPPVNTNARLTLPNKLFDYVQARLAVAVGPTVEMVDVVEEFGLGVVSSGFGVEDIVASLDSLTRESVRGFKEASDRASERLGFESEARTAHGILEDMLR